MFLARVENFIKTSPFMIYYNALKRNKNQIKIKIISFLKLEEKTQAW